MARWRGLQVAHLAAYEDPGEYRVRPHRVSDDAGQLGDREGRGDAWSVFPRDGDRIHSPLSAHASWKVSTDGGEIGVRVAEASAATEVAWTHGACSHRPT